MKDLRKPLWAVVAVAVVSGCAVRPQPITDDEQRQLVATDRAWLHENQEPITEPITLEQAVARALAHNLDHRLMLLNIAVLEHQLDASKLDMLPSLLANAGFNSRTRDYLTISQDTVTGSLSPNPALSMDRTRRMADLTLNWNVLDFGVSYFQAKQNADRLLIAEQQRRRVTHQIIQQVRAAYWRAATAEPLHARVVPLLDDARRALDDARAVEAQRLSPPLEVLRYQKDLVELVRELDALEYDLQIARAELAALVGVAPGAAFAVALPPPESMAVPSLGMTVDEMELAALVGRPELMEEHYQRRISALETRRALLRLLPGLNFSGSANYDSNSFLVHNNWAEASARVTGNLLNVVTGPTVMRAARAGEEAADMRRLALSMAVLTQVHVGYHHFQRASSAYEQTRLVGEIEGRIFAHSQRASAAATQSPLERIRAELTAIYSEVNSYRSYAAMQGAFANLHVAMGMDPLPEFTSDEARRARVDALRALDADEG